MKKIFRGSVIFRPGNFRGLQKWTSPRRRLWASQKSRMNLPSHRGARTSLAGRHK